MGGEAWSADREFSAARGLGMYSPRGQDVLRYQFWCIDILPTQEVTLKESRV